MARLALDFGCGSLKLAASLDTAPGSTGLLLVSGGNEIRSGAFSGQAELAATIAKAGFPVFRFDRRGIGDSEGDNRGFRSSAGDIAAAVKAFRALAPQIDRVIGFGNCDAASALMLTSGAGFDGLILSNPWTLENADAQDADTPGDPPPAASPTPAAIRARYAEKLKNPSEVGRLLRGGVDLRKLARGLLKSASTASQPSSLANEMFAGLAQFEGPVRILLAGADRTAQAFEQIWDDNDTRFTACTVQRCSGAGHSYVEPADRDWLAAQILASLRSNVQKG